MRTLKNPCCKLILKIQMVLFVKELCGNPDSPTADSRTGADIEPSRARHRTLSAHRQPPRCRGRARVCDGRPAAAHLITLRLRGAAAGAAAGRRAAAGALCWNRAGREERKTGGTGATTPSLWSDRTGPGAGEPALCEDPR
eukprot:gene18234-biopygen17387